MRSCFDFLKRFLPTDRMDRLCFLCMLAAFVVSCGRKTSETAPKILSEKFDSIAWADSMLVDITDEPVVYNIDGSFEDFILQYFSDHDTQVERTVFPLPCTVLGKDTLLSQDAWVEATPLADIQVYATVYDKEADMEAEKDTSLNKVVVELYKREKETVGGFTFLRINGAWKLCRMDEVPLSSNARSEFVRFYWEFVNDSIYQDCHVQDPLTFVTVDPEDDFNIIEATIDKEQWFAFAPPLPDTLFVHFDYGTKVRRRTSKVLTVKSVVDEFCCTFYFRRSDKEWTLSKYEDVSN